MFEKEAEEYAEINKPFLSKYDCVCVFQDGAEFGYNKALEEQGDKIESAYREGVAFGKDKLKDEWHKVSEQVPTEEKQYLLKFKDGTIDVLYVGIDGNLEPFILTRECFEFYKDVEKWCEIPEE